jgi:uncharacterized surface protein with fasciclin (FAS1) repeats
MIMKTNRNLPIMALVLTMSLTMTVSQATAGDCGASATKAKATHAMVTESVPAIYDLAGEAGFTTLTAAIDAAGLSETLNSDGPFTVFAPTDEAFAKLPAGTLESLLADKEALTKVLLYHVASGEVMAAEVVDLLAAQTLNGEKVKIGVENGVTINDANVIKTDVRAQNGVIHVIDTVLIPSNL